MVIPGRHVLLDLSVKKLWVLGRNDILETIPYLHKYVYASELETLHLKDYHPEEPYLYKDFVKMAPTLTTLTVWRHIYLGNDTLTLGDILIHTPNLIKFEHSYIDSSPIAYNISPSTTTDLLPKLPKLNEFTLHLISSFPDTALMLQFIKNHDAKFLFVFDKHRDYDSFKTAVLKAYPESEELTLFEFQNNHDFDNVYNGFAEKPSAKIQIFVYD